MSYIFATLTEIAREWAAALLADEALDAWCRDEAGRALRVFVAPASGQKNEWGRSDAPYVVIMPLGDRTGTDRAEHEFELFLHMGVVMPGTVEGVAWREPKGFAALDRDFSGLVLAALERTDYAPAEVEGEIFPGQDSFFERDMAVTVRVPVTIGGRATGTIG